MDTELKTPLKQQADEQMIAILAELGISEISPDTLKNATLSGDLLLGAKSVIDAETTLEKPIH